MTRTMGPKAFWPIAAMMAMTGLGGAKLLQRAYEGPNREEERILEAIKSSRIPAPTPMAAMPTGTLVGAR
jgi:hypothetical protein